MGLIGQEHFAQLSKASPTPRVSLQCLTLRSEASLQDRGEELGREDSGGNVMLVFKSLKDPEVRRPF